MLVNKETELLVGMIDEWFLEVREQVEDISGWRDSARERVHFAHGPGGWRKLPDNFFTTTSYLFQRIAADHPKLDPTPIQDLYDAIAAWHEDHNADRLPDQPVLEATLRRAEIMLGAVSAAECEGTPVEDQGDAGQYQLSSVIEGIFGLSHKRLKGFLKAHPEIKTKPQSRRLYVHVLDFFGAIRRDKIVADSPALAKQIEKNLQRAKLDAKIEAAALALFLVK